MNKSNMSKGTHEELLGKNELYTSLYYRKFADDTAEIT